MENNEIIIYKNRLLVSDLIIDVLTDKKSVREALSYFPDSNDDINIKCAFDALVHREADEDLRKKIQDYKKVQDDYLLELSEYLKNNQKLPQNIIDRYVYYHKENLVGIKENFLQSVLKNLKRMINL